MSHLFWLFIHFTGTDGTVTLTTIPFTSPLPPRFGLIVYIPCKNGMTTSGHFCRYTRSYKRSSATAETSHVQVGATSPNGHVKARLTRRGYQKELHGHEDFYSGAASITYLEALLVFSVKLGHVVAFGDCCGASYQAPSDEEVHEEREVVWKCWRAIHRLKGAPKGLGHALKEETDWRKLRFDTSAIRWLRALRPESWQKVRATQ